MGDINFFSYYIKKNKNVLKEHNIFYCFLVICIIGIICYGLLNNIKIRNLTNEVELLEKYFITLNEDDRLKEIIDIKENIRVLKENEESLNALENYVNNRDFINEQLLEEIKSSIPEKVFLDYISINIDSIRIEGKAKDKESISQFQHELNQNAHFTKVFIPEIVKEDAYFTFYLDIWMEERDFGTENWDE